MPPPPPPPPPLSAFSSGEKWSPLPPLLLFLCRRPLLQNERKKKGRGLENMAAPGGKGGQTWPNVQKPGMEKPRQRTRKEEMEGGGWKTVRARGPNVGQQAGPRLQKPNAQEKLLRPPRFDPRHNGPNGFCCSKRPRRRRRILSPRLLLRTKKPSSFSVDQHNRERGGEGGEKDSSSSSGL